MIDIAILFLENESKCSIKFNTQDFIFVLGIFKFFIFEEINNTSIKINNKNIQIKNKNAKSRYINLFLFFKRK